VNNFYGGRLAVAFSGPTLSAQAGSKWDSIRLHRCYISRSEWGPRFASSLGQNLFVFRLLEHNQFFDGLVSVDWSRYDLAFELLQFALIMFGSH
jgi:hypothetical protein